MDFYQLKAFLVTAQEKNFSRAAEILHVSQPAVSSRIINLERELNLDLFEKEGRTIKLSTYGEILLPFAKRILELTDEAKDSLNAYLQTEKGHLKIGTTNRIGTYILPPLLKKFQTTHPDIKITVHINSSEAIIGRLLDRSIIIALVNNKISNSNYIQIPLFKDPVVLVSAKDHPLYQHYHLNGIISLKDLVKFVIINFNHELTYYQPIIELFRENNIYPEQTISVNNIEAMKRMAARSIGIAFLPKIAVIKELREEILMEIAYPQQERLLRETLLIYPNSRFLNPAISEFITILNEFFLDQKTLDDVW